MGQIPDSGQNLPGSQKVSTKPEVAGVGVKHKGVLKKFPKTKGKNTLFLILGSLLVVLGGVGTGWLLSGGILGSDGDRVTKESISEIEVSGTEAGYQDESYFEKEEITTAEGLLVEGGISGEGTHHLERGVGPSQYAYLTSTVIDLQSFVGKKVKVWGETLSGQTAGWLMDVGKIKVIE